MNRITLFAVKFALFIGPLSSFTYAQIGIFDKTTDWPLGDNHIEGNVSVSGTGNNVEYSVEGNGAFGSRIEEILGVAGDEGFYVYTEKTGSFSLEAHLFPLYGQTALMIREDAEDPTSNFYSIEMANTGLQVNALFRTRTGAGGNVRVQLSDEDGNPIQDVGDGLWLRVTRVEPVDVFFSEYSPDGVNWFIADNRVIDWPSETAAYGIAAGSGADDDIVGLIEADNVRFVSTPPVALREISKQFYKSGDTLEVTLKAYVSGTDRSTVTIEETPPAGWQISQVSNDGNVSNGNIRWNLSNLPVGETLLTYRVTVPASPAESVIWSGNVRESVHIVGHSTLPLLDITGGERVDNGLVSLYNFEERDGTLVFDVSENGDPMNLLIEDPSTSRWGESYLETTGVNHIETDGPATKIIDACKASDELTVEGWIQTSDISQNGPARMITCSIDTSNRNFTLGQGRFNAGSNRFEMRYRTTDNNEFQMNTPIGSLTEALTHVVWTRSAEGKVAAYINNKPQETLQNGNIPTEDLTGSFSTWNDTYKFGLGNEVSAARAWLGKFYLVALYNRALTADEVSQNYNAGPFVGQTEVLEWSLY